jgi:DedD protein
MNDLLDNQETDDANGRRDREITLGTSTVLGIFFGLAILCAAFFGFGYSLGSKHSTPNVTANGDPLTHSLSTVKPSPGSPIGATAKPIPAGAAVPASTQAPAETKPPAAPPPGAAAPPEAFEPDQPLPKPSRNPPPAPVLASSSTAPAIAPGGQFVVQVAALSHQEDAELIVTTLERRGYTVAIHPDPADKLLHVQIGPFATRKDADAMRQKLLADGFNAYIK